MEKTQKELNYERIAKAIQYIQDHFQEKPSLDAIAEHVHLSPFHFQRLFSDWAGTSPKKFLQYTQVNYAKKLLKEEQKTLFETHLLTGVGSTSRLHDMFVQIEGMTPAEYKQGAEGMDISYSWQETPFGICLVASTEKGICYMAFVDQKEEGVQEFEQVFENANLSEQELPIHLEAVRIFNPEDNSLKRIKLHLKGTPFQLKVWQALLQIPLGEVSSYKDIANKIEQPNASRAVGTAIGQNPIAYLIPCHRVIQTTGQTGGYRWKPIRKSVILGWEFAQNDKEITNEAI
ncbi:bifunctional transcriptional activator/DNA repair enzyme AdaA [Sphingobacterium endophyticum]|uniref:bifunctional transcriptional activator/DNA repair enzyme AdaA n=1 Tax=Sphingobacterium endophyticum TaxID=2546448 RepID=UPI0012E2F839|nr:methylated-DNA--[protein]-cysteine S-methyltransferase [Sphingobacterium endophyticum]